MSLILFVLLYYSLQSGFKSHPSALCWLVRKGRNKSTRRLSTQHLIMCIHLACGDCCRHLRLWVLRTWRNVAKDWSHLMIWYTRWCARKCLYCKALCSVVWVFACTGHYISSIVPTLGCPSLSVWLSVYVHCSVVTLLARYNDIELLRKAVSKQKVNIVLTAAARVRACVQIHVIGWCHVIALRTRRHLAGNIWKRFDVHLLYEISCSWYALNQSISRSVP